MPDITLLFTRTDLRATIPSKAHFDDAAFDLYPLEDIDIKPLQQELIDTGIRVLIPRNYWIKFHERSGLANKGIQVHGGVIDYGYTGNLKVILYNGSNFTVHIPKNKAITQFTLEEMTRPYLLELSKEEYEKSASDRLRGEKGFGSSDEKSS